MEIVEVGNSSTRVPFLVSAKVKSCVLFYMKVRIWSLGYYSHLSFHKIKARINFSRSTKIGSTPLNVLELRDKRGSRISSWLFYWKLWESQLCICVHSFSHPELLLQGLRKVSTVCEGYHIKFIWITPKLKTDFDLQVMCQFSFSLYTEFLLWH